MFGLFVVLGLALLTVTLSLGSPQMVGGAIMVGGAVFLYLAPGLLAVVAVTGPRPRSSSLISRLAGPFSAGSSR